MQIEDTLNKIAEYATGMAQVQLVQSSEKTEVDQQETRMKIKSTKEPTQFVPFNLTKPKPFKIPDPIKITK